MLISTFHSVVAAFLTISPLTYALQFFLLHHSKKPECPLSPHPGDPRRGEPLPVLLSSGRVRGDLRQVLEPADALPQQARRSRPPLPRGAPGGGPLPPLLGVRDGRPLREICEFLQYISS